MALLCHEHDVLPLRAIIPGGLNGPSICPLNIINAMLHVEDRFDGKCHTWSHLGPAGPRRALMMHKRRHMQVLANAMAAELFIHFETMTVGVVLNHLSNLIEFGARLA